MAAMKTMWKGHLMFSLVNFPIKIYKAVESGESVHFNQFHKDCNGSVGRKNYCKACSKEVKTEEIIKGYVTDNSDKENLKFVQIDKSDVDSIKLKSTKTIEIEAFVNKSEIPEILYEEPYYLGTDGPLSEKVYSMFTQALGKSGDKVAIGKIVLRDREDMVAISLSGKTLVMSVIRYKDELRNADEVVKSLPDVNPQEVMLAKSLIDQMTKSFDQIDTINTNNYNKAMKEMIQNKIDGKVSTTSTPVAAQPAVDIMAALQASIAAAAAAKQGSDQTTQQLQTN